MYFVLEFTDPGVYTQDYSVPGGGGRGARGVRRGARGGRGAALGGRGQSDGFVGGMVGFYL